MENTVDSSWDDIGRLILRVTIGGLLLFHGIGKVIHGVSWMIGLLAAHHLPAFIRYGVYVGEVVAPILLIIGFLTRPAALAIVIDLVMALVLVAYRRALTLTPGGSWGIEVEAFFLLGAAAVFFLGPGRYRLTPFRFAMG